MTLIDEIKTLLAEHPSLSVQEISQALEKTTARKFQNLVKTVATLEADGQVVILENGKIRLNQLNKELVGIFRGNERGYGFVSVEGYDTDFYVGKGDTNQALSGDTVVIALTKEATLDKGAEARVLRVDKRYMTQLVGEFKPYNTAMQERTQLLGYVVPKERTLADLTCFIKPGGLQAPVDGTIVVVSIDSYPTAENPKSLTGVLINEVGHKDAPGVDILTILHKFDIPTQFPAAVLAEADAIASVISPEELENRRDLRHDMVITIDGADAKDLDDAISLRLLDNGHYLLGVHIADVSHYVTEHSALDNEAYERGTSVYLVDRVVPMLPQRLSNGICSLHPDEDRLTVSCEMEIDASGTVVSYELFNSVIRSQKRMVYDTVNAAITEQNKHAIEEYAAFLPMLENMRDLHYALYHKRRRRGAIDFEASEAKIQVDEHGKPRAILLRERGLAERMIESFMLLANETVAKHFQDKAYPFIYRVHEQPAEDKMQRFMSFVTNFGILMKGTHETVSSKDLQVVLNKVSDEAYEAVVSTMLLRSMKQARYDVAPLGHFGLATEDYTHFTSPIRRYPDLIVHRLMKRYLHKKPRKNEYPALEQKIEAIAQQSSAMERRAVDAERDTEALKKAEFMLDKVGETFAGVISSVTRFGIFVELDNTVEGLIHVSKMKDDHYEFIENHLMLVGTRTGQTYQIGQKVTIKVTKVSVETRDIDFELVVSNKEKKQLKREKYKKIAKKEKVKTKKFVKRKQKRRR